MDRGSHTLCVCVCDLQMTSLVASIAQYGFDCDGFRNLLSTFQVSYIILSALTTSPFGPSLRTLIEVLCA